MKGKVNNEAEKPGAAKDMQVQKAETLPYIEVNVLEDLQPSTEKAGDQELRTGSWNQREGMLCPKPRQQRRSIENHNVSCSTLRVVGASALEDELDVGAQQQEQLAIQPSQGFHTISRSQLLDDLLAPRRGRLRSGQNARSASNERAAGSNRSQLGSDVGSVLVHYCMLTPREQVLHNAGFAAPPDEPLDPVLRMNDFLVKKCSKFLSPRGVHHQNDTSQQQQSATSAKEKASGGRRSSPHFNLNVKSHIYGTTTTGKERMQQLQGPKNTGASKEGGQLSPKSQYEELALSVSDQNQNLHDLKKKKQNQVPKNLAVRADATAKRHGVHPSIRQIIEPLEQEDAQIEILKPSNKHEFTVLKEHAEPRGNKHRLSRVNENREASGQVQSSQNIEDSSQTWMVNHKSKDKVSLFKHAKTNKQASDCDNSNIFASQTKPSELVAATHGDQQPSSFKTSPTAFKKVSRISTLRLMPQGIEQKNNLLAHQPLMIAEVEHGSASQEKEEQDSERTPSLMQDRLSARNMVGEGSSFRNSRSSLINLSKYRNELKQEQTMRSAQRRYRLLQEKATDKLNYDQLVANFVKPLPNQVGSQGPWSQVGSRKSSGPLTASKTKTNATSKLSSMHFNRVLRNSYQPLPQSSSVRQRVEMVMAKTKSYYIKKSEQILSDRALDRPTSVGQSQMMRTRNGESYGTAQPHHSQTPLNFRAGAATEMLSMADRDMKARTFTKGFMVNKRASASRNNNTSTLKSQSSEYKAVNFIKTQSLSNVQRSCNFKTSPAFNHEAVEILQRQLSRTRQRGGQSRYTDFAKSLSVINAAAASVSNIHVISSPQSSNHPKSVAGTSVASMSDFTATKKSPKAATGLQLNKSANQGFLYQNQNKVLFSLGTVQGVKGNPAENISSKGVFEATHKHRVDFDFSKSQQIKDDVKNLKLMRAKLVRHQQAFAQGAIQCKETYNEQEQQLLDEIQAKVQSQTLQQQMQVLKSKALFKDAAADMSEMSATGLGDSTERQNDRNIQKMKDMQRLKNGTIRKQVKRIEKQERLIQEAFRPATAKPAVFFDESEESVLDHEISKLRRETAGEGAGCSAEMEAQLAEGDLDVPEQETQEAYWRRQQTIHRALMKQERQSVFCLQPQQYKKEKRLPKKERSQQARCGLSSTHFMGYKIPESQKKTTRYGWRAASGSRRTSKLHILASKDSNLLDEGNLDLNTSEAEVNYTNFMKKNVESMINMSTQQEGNIFEKLLRPAPRKEEEGPISPRINIKLQVNASKASSEFLAQPHKINFNPKFKEHDLVVADPANDYGYAGPDQPKIMQSHVNDDSALPTSLMLIKGNITKMPETDTQIHKCLERYSTQVIHEPSSPTGHIPSQKAEPGDLFSVDGARRDREQDGRQRIGINRIALLDDTFINNNNTSQTCEVQDLHPDTKKDQKRQSSSKERSSPFIGLLALGHDPDRPKVLLIDNQTDY